MFIDKDGKQKPIIMGCYGIGVSRLLMAVLEQHYKDDKAIWPTEIRPFDVHILPLDKEGTLGYEKAVEIYNKLTEKGYDLERGIKGSDNKHIKIKEYKQITKKVNHELNVRNNRLDKAMNDFEEKMKTTKQTLIIDKDFIKVRKDT